MVLPAGEQAVGGAPLLDERYVGYGKNKVQWVQDIRGDGFEFFVLPPGFLLHFPHAMSKSGRRWQKNANNHKEVRQTRLRPSSLCQSLLPPVHALLSRAPTADRPRS